MKDPILSIYVATYNHEHYITQALDSILMQKTKYTCEVLVGEDCSTDNTRAVLKEYEKKHPGKFTIFYREHNMRNELIDNVMDLMLQCRGKYIIALEGDDYWTDPHKLEKQIDFLEAHPEYIAVSHNCVVVDHNSLPKNEAYPECKEEEYTFAHYFSEILPGQLATVMYRNMFINPQYDLSILEKKLIPGDRVIYFWLLVNGKVHCIQEVMSAYRHVTTQGSSYSATYKYRFEDYRQLYDELLQYAQRMNHAQAIKIAQRMYFKHMIRGIRYGLCDVSEFLQYCGKMDGKLNSVWGYIVYKFRKDIMRSKLWI